MNYDSAEQVRDWKCTLFLLRVWHPDYSMSMYTQLIVVVMLTTFRTRFIHHNIIILFLQQQNASQTRTRGFLYNVEYLTWYGVVNVASVWHAHVAAVSSQRKYKATSNVFVG